MDHEHLPSGTEEMMAADDVEPAAAAHASYFRSRFSPDPRRDSAWRHIAAYLSRWWEPTAAVVDVGAGYCSFINAVVARRRVAVDIHDQLPKYAAPDVECIQTSATDLRVLEESSFDVVFASNVLEHLTRAEIEAGLAEFRRVLRQSGRLILIQPNFRLCANEYFDDYTHVTPLSDRSLADLLRVAAFAPVAVRPRFLPLTLRSPAARLSFLLPLYLRSPWRPRAKQMLLVARPAKGE
jgi:SAM-dependent methyltransferase